MGDEDGPPTTDEGDLHGEPASKHREPRAPHRHRVRGRGSGGDGSRYPKRDRHPRQRRELPIEELLGLLISTHGLTEAVREQCICMFWRDIVDARIADRTLPDSISRGVLKLSTEHPVWVHELRFFKAQMIQQINAWIDAHRAWLGPSPLVSDIRIGLGVQRERLVDPDQLRRLQLRHQRRLRPRGRLPPVISEADREAIRAETSLVEDEDLRATIELVRTTWNR